MNLKALGQKLRALFGNDTKGLEAFEFDTAGSAENTLGTIPSPKLSPLFAGGWWGGARRFDIHTGRLGGNISAWSTVVHSTDMLPGTMAPLLKRWRAVAGEGAGAHFLIGKQLAGENDPVPTGGIVQMAPITRNGNHAGGSIDGKPSHGNFKTAAGKLIHPNSVAIGIEIDNAGRLVKKGGNWIHRDSGKIIGDVFVDTRGRGWERYTPYQLGALGLLLDVLDEQLVAAPAGVTVVPNGTYAANGVPDAALDGVREVGHWTLDPTRKSDPGPQITDFLRYRAAMKKLS